MLLQGHQVRILTYLYLKKSFFSRFVLSIKSLNEKVILSKFLVVYIYICCKDILCLEFALWIESVYTVNPFTHNDTYAIKVHKTSKFLEILDFFFIFMIAPKMLIFYHYVHRVSLTLKITPEHSIFNKISIPKTLKF